MVEVHGVSECLAWGVHGGGFNWVVRICAGLEMGLTGGDWDRGQSVVGKLATSPLWGLVDQCLTELGGWLVCCLELGSRCVLGLGPCHV